MSSQQIEFAITESIMEEEIHEILNWLKAKWYLDLKSLKSSGHGKWDPALNLNILQNNTLKKVQKITCIYCS